MPPNIPHDYLQMKYCLQCKNPQCKKGCPINTPIPEVIQLLKENKLDEAGKQLFENNPLTTVCSLICNHERQCEGHCILGKKGAAIQISNIEQYVSRSYAPKMVKGPAEWNGMRVAIIGSGGIDDLFRDGYKAIFVGTGVWKPKALHIKGETLGHVHFGINYLNNPDSFKLGQRELLL